MQPLLSKLALVVIIMVKKVSADIKRLVVHLRFGRANPSEASHTFLRYMQIAKALNLTYS